MDYVFVASCNGLESLNPITSVGCCWSAIDMYCRTNMHRGCIYGTIELEEDIYEGLLHFLKNGDGDIALNLIKQAPYSFLSSSAKYFKRIMDKIPNNDLDWTRM